MAAEQDPQRSARPREDTLKTRLIVSFLAGGLISWACSGSSSFDEGSDDADGGAPGDAPATSKDGDISLEGATDGGADDDADARADASDAEPATYLPSEPQLTANELGLLINTDDPQSVAIGDFYVEERKIPAGNVVRLALGAPTGRNVSAATFATWKAQVDAALPANVQALAIAFTMPSIVQSCESITAAFTFGYDAKYCVACGGGPLSPYYTNPAPQPFTALGIRPAMMLAASSIEEGKKLITRGVAADATFPMGDGYFIRTNDAARSNPRYTQFQATVAEFDPNVLELTYFDQLDGGAANLLDASNVLLYMTGRPSVPGITTNTYRPGAFTDHLTSYAGVFDQSCAPTGQMNVLCWLEAGATASYGTVVEPCAWPQKFPEPQRFVEAYFHGKTMIEAAWASVAWPGQGVFVGEPLARPFGTRTMKTPGVGVTIETTELLNNAHYALERAPAAAGPWSAIISDISTTHPTRYVVDVPLGPRFVRFTKK